MSSSIFAQRFKKFAASALVASLFLNPMAFATSSSLELDFKYSNTSDRLHTMMPLSNVRDISHLEIDVDKQKVSIHKKNETAERVEEALDLEAPPQSPCDTVLNLPHENIYNLPWHLDDEDLKCFLSQHTAWLTPLSKDDYKIEFRGHLLGGGSDNEGDSGDGGYGSGGDSGGYDNYGSSGGDYGTSSNQGCPASGVQCDSNDRCIPCVNIHANDPQPSENTQSSDTGRSYGKSSDGGSRSNNDSSESHNNTQDQESPGGSFIDESGGTICFDRRVPLRDQPTVVQDFLSREAQQRRQNEAAANQPAADPTPQPAPAPQFNLESFTELFNNAGVNQPAPAPQPTPDNFADFFNNLVPNQPAASAPTLQPTPNDFADFFNNLVPNQPAAPAPTSQPTPNNFADIFNNLVPNQPAPAPAPVAEQPANPAPTPAAVETPAPVVEQPANPEPAPQPTAEPVPTPQAEQPVAPTPEPAAETPAPQPAAEPTSQPVVEQPVVNPDAAQPAAEQTLAPEPVVELTPNVEQPDQPFVQQVNFRGFDPNLLNQGGRVGGTGMSGGGAKPNLNSSVGIKNQPSASQPARIVNPPKAESPVWKDLKPYRGQYKTDAKREKYYEWDHLHNEIEVYTSQGKHLGAMDPKTGEMIKPAEIGRTIQL